MSCRTRVPFLALATVASLMLSVVPGVAASAESPPTWEEPQPIPGAKHSEYADALTTRGGTNVVKWERPGGTCTPVNVAVRPGDAAAWTSMKASPADTGSTFLLDGGRNRVVLSWTTCDGKEVRFQRVRHDRLGPVRVVPLPDVYYISRVAMNDRGGFVVLWEDTNDGVTTLAGSLHLPHGGWQSLPTLALQGTNIIEHVQLTNDGQVTVVTGIFTDTIIASTFSNGSWASEIVAGPDATYRLVRSVSSTDGHLTISWLPSNDDGTFDIVMASRRPGEPFQEPELIKEDRPCHSSYSMCAAIDMEVDGDVAAIWPMGEVGDGEYHFARRDADSGAWTKGQDLVDPHPRADPNLDVHARGNAAVWIDDIGGDRGATWQCRSHRPCVAVRYPPRHQSGEFIAGPHGSQTAIFGDLRCGEECTTIDLAGARLNP